MWRWFDDEVLSRPIIILPIAIVLWVPGYLLYHYVKYHLMV